MHKVDDSACHAGFLKRKMRLTTGCIILVWCAFSIAGQKPAGTVCNTMAEIRGTPSNYYSSAPIDVSRLESVERGHMNTNVRSLQSGQTAPLPGDLYFALNSFPNHPHALDIYSRFEHTYRNSEYYRNSRGVRRPTYDAECFFERAVRLFSGQGETLMVWGIHRHRNGDYEGAIQKYQQALSQGYNTAPLHYNMGLSYLELGDWAAADRHERRASEMGYSLQGLRNRLKSQEKVNGSESP